MRQAPSDEDLLRTAAQRLGVDAETIMRRYYGSPGDARDEIEEFERTGRLQESLADALRLKLGELDPAAE